MASHTVNISWKSEGSHERGCVLQSWKPLAVEPVAFNGQSQ